MADLLATLNRLNVEVNGSPPSESSTGLADLPRAVACAVSEIAGKLREAVAIFERLGAFMASNPVSRQGSK